MPGCLLSLRSSDPLLKQPDCVSSELTAAGTVAAKVFGLGPQPGLFHADT